MIRSTAVSVLTFAMLGPFGMLAVAPASVSAAAAEEAAPRLEGIEPFINEVMTQWHVPGLAIAVVKDDRAIYTKGFGYRDVEKKLPVTPQTLLAIGSITKSFTVTALGTLVDEGKLDWDKPVRGYLPDFRLHDDVATRAMTARDLVTHRSGLPRHDALWYGSLFGRKELYDRLRHLEPSKDFRGAWQYQNLMFMTAGYLAGQTAGTTWEALARERIFAPLGMEKSNFSVRDSRQADDFALPYMLQDGAIKRVPFRNLDAIGPAGSINSNALEMSRYVRLHINLGKHSGERLLSESVARQMQTPQMVMPARDEHAELGHQNYGMGFMITTYRGHKLVTHGGGIDGFISLLSFLPREKIGVVVLTNMSGTNPVPAIVTRNVIDRLLGHEPIDWNGRITSQTEKARRAEKEAKKNERPASKADTEPSHSLADFAGRYEHPGYGICKIQVDGDRLTAAFNGAALTLERVHYDVFKAAQTPLAVLADKTVQFFYNKKGDIDRLAIPLEASVDDIVFRRVADPELSRQSVLAPLAGRYRLATVTVTVALEGDRKLTLTVPGQPTYELVPTRGMSFDIKGQSGYSVEFARAASGAIVELVLQQPNGTFVAKRKSPQPVEEVATNARATKVRRDYDLVILNGRIVDGTGNPSFYGDVAIRDGRIARVTPAGLLKDAAASKRIDAHGLVVAPGFIDILSHSRGAFLTGDGRVVSKVTQGITTEIMGEGWTNAPVNDRTIQITSDPAAAELADRFTGPRGFGKWLQAMHERGTSPNVGSFLGAATVRGYAKGMAQGPATPDELAMMRQVVRDAMADGAFGVASALIYPPGNFAGTEELIEIGKAMAPYGGVYITHMRSEADHLLEAIDEAIQIGREGGVPVEIYHLKAAGRRNWHKAPLAVARIEAARAEGLDIGADMYPYIAGATGLTACLPPWASADGKLFDNLADAKMRAKIRAEVLDPKTQWENLGELATPEGVLVLDLRKPENMHLAGKRLSEIAAAQGKHWVDAAMDLILSEQQRIGTVYFMMSDENVQLQMRQPWMKFGTDAGGVDPEKPEGLVHPRAYGTYPRILGKYVREDRVLRLEEAIRKMTSAVAARLSIHDRGLLREGFYADVVIFDANTIGDRATFPEPHQLSVGIRHVLVNGTAVVRNALHTGAKPGKIVRGPGYSQ